MPDATLNVANGGYLPLGRTDIDGSAVDEGIRAIDADDGAAGTARRADFRDAQGVVCECDGYYY